MTAISLDSAAQRVLDVLLNERECLLAGKVAEACNLLGEKRRALFAFENAMAAQADQPLSPPEMDLIKSVHDLAEENRLHMESIRSGLDALIRRMSSMQEIVDVGAYTSKGKKKRFQRSEGSYSVSR